MTSSGGNDHRRATRLGLLLAGGALAVAFLWTARADEAPRPRVAVVGSTAQDLGTVSSTSDLPAAKQAVRDAMDADFAAQKRTTVAKDPSVRPPVTTPEPQPLLPSLVTDLRQLDGIAREGEAPLAGWNGAFGSYISQVLAGATTDGRGFIWVRNDAQTDSGDLPKGVVGWARRTTSAASKGLTITAVHGTMVDVVETGSGERLQFDLATGAATPDGVLVAG